MFLCGDDADADADEWSLVSLQQKASTSYTTRFDDHDDDGEYCDGDGDDFGDLRGINMAALEGAWCPRHIWPPTPMPPLQRRQGNQTDCQLSGSDGWWWARGVLGRVAPTRTNRDRIASTSSRQSDERKMWKKFYRKYFLFV